MYDRKLVIVQNPYSTRHREVQAGVFDRLDTAGIPYDTITTRFSQAKDNIKYLADRLPDDAHIISAAGDGTSTQVVNAGLRAELDGAVYSFIGYGNAMIWREVSAIRWLCCKVTTTPLLINHSPLR